MKGVYCCIFFVFMSLSYFVSAQTDGDYRSRQTGNWNSVTTWQVFNAAAWHNLEDAGAGTFQNVIPSSSSGLITVITNFSVTIPAAYAATANSVTVTSATATSLIIANGGSLSFNGVLTLGSGPSGRGTLRIEGLLQVNNGATIAGSLTGSRITVTSTGVYRHNYTTAAGQIYTSQWDAGSTLEISGYTSNTAEPTGLNQSFRNVTWNCALQAADMYFSGLNFTTILENFNLQNSNGFIVGLTTTNNTTLTIDGNLTTGVNSFLDLSGGTATGAIGLKGNFTMADNDGVGNFGTGTATLTFNGTAVQNYVSTKTIASSVNIVVANSSILKIADTDFISTLGTFTLEASSNLQVGSTDINGAIQLGTSAGNIRVANANRIYNTSSNIIYNGTSLQRIGNGFPSNVNLEIANASGVTNNNIGVTNVVGNLTLTTGALNIGSSNTLNIQSNFFTTVNGSIGGDATSNLTFSGSGTLNTLRFASGKESLNNLTVSRIADLVLGSNLTVSGTIDLSGGNLDFSGQTLTMNGGSITSNATGLKSSSTSNLTFGGSTFTGSIPFSGTGNQLNTLTFATNGGAYTWNSGVTVNTSVYLSAGTLTHTSGITMAANSTIFKGAGSMTSSSPVAASSYNVTYTGTGDTGLELPTTATALNNLTITSTGTVTLAAAGITVNGDLLISGGTFAAGANNFTMKGANWTISGGVFTPGTGTVSFSGTTAIGGTGTTSFNNLTVTGTGILTLPSNTMNILSNLVNDGTINKGAGTVAFVGTTAITGTGTTSLNNVVVNASSSLTAPSGTLNVAADFTNNGTFTHNSGTINFNGTSSVTGTVNFGHVTISNILNAPATLNISGNFTNNGTFNRGTGTVVFNGSTIQNIQGTAVTDFNNINVTNTGGTPAVQVQSNANLRAVLTLVANSSFDADGSVDASVFTLISSGDNPTADAGIATLPTGASVTGNVTVQRYMAIEGTGGRMYRYIASPVQTAAVSQIQTEIPVTGSFTGSSTCSGCTTNQSMFQYNESVITGDLNSGYADFPDAANTETLAAARGYAIYVRGDVDPVLSATTARWDVRAPINSGTVSFPATFTSSGTLANDGWNLVGNPYPSTIDWDAASGWTRTGINKAIYMRDNGAGGVVASYVGTVEANGGSRYIAIGQGFFVKSDGGPITFEATENVKVAGQQTTFFREKTISDILRITLRQGSSRDESVIRFSDNATAEFDGDLDAHKLKNGIFNLSSLTSNGLKLVINALPKISCGTTVNMDISDAAPGAYQLEFSEFESFSNDVQISVYDAFTDTRLDARTVSSYHFEVTADSSSFGTGRISISFFYNNPAEALVEFPLEVCKGGEALIDIQNSETYVSYSVYRGGVSITEAVYGNGGPLQIPLDGSLLSSGDNDFVLHYSPEGCQSMVSSKQIRIKSLDLPDLTTTDGSSCGEGNVSLTASGAEEGNYLWYETETDNMAIAGASSGTYITPLLNKSKTYYVSAINALGCEGGRKPVAAVIHQYNEVAITLDGGLNRLTSSYETGNQWYFNGEAIPGATGKTVEVNQTGLYEVEVKIGSCTSRAGREMVILGLENESGKGYGFFPNPVKDKFTIELDRTDIPTKGMVFSSSGRPLGVIDFKVKSQKLIGEYSFAEQAAGMYLIRILQGNKIIHYKVIKK